MKNKILRVIRMAAFYSVLGIIIQAFIVNILFAVSPVEGQIPSNVKVNLNVSNASLEQVLNIIEQKTHFTFSYFKDDINSNEKISIDAQEEPLRNVLEKISDKYDLTFTRINDVIVIKKIKENRIEEKNIDNVQSFGTLRGVVRDSITAEVLPFANVYLKETRTGASTDKHGYFIIPSIPALKNYTIIISFVGYVTESRTVNIEANKITHINILLKPTVVEMRNVVVTEKRNSDVVDISLKNISMNELENLPKGVETDILRSIQLQAGVQSTGDVSAHYYVRGGASNENLVLLNETPIYNPFHALGIFSVIDPDMINSIEFYKGGFGAMYDGRLSSVMNIITKDGNRNNYGAMAAVSQLTAKALLEGPIPHGSFIITGRKSHSNKILKKFLNQQSVPIDFYDLSFKVHYSNPEFLPISKFTLFGFKSNDVIDYGNELKPSFNWSNSHLGFNWFVATENSPLFANLTLYYCKFQGSEIPNLSNNRYMENEIDDITFKGDVRHVSNDKNEYYGGVKINYIKNKLFLNNVNKGLKNVGTENSRFSIYGGYSFLNIDDLKADFSSRFNIKNLSESSAISFEPRINVSYRLIPVLNLKAAWGIYQQELVTISDEDEIISLFEPWLIIPSELKPSTSIHYIGGVDFFLGERTKITAEGYYKIMHNLTAVNDDIFLPNDPLLVAASGKSYGAEVTLNHSDGRINTQLSYSYSWTLKKVGELEYHPRYDSRNAVKFYISYDLGKSWNASATWEYNSGMPFTQLAGFYDRYNPRNIINPSTILTSYMPYQMLGKRNAVFLPDYHRLDISLSKKLNLSFMKLSIDVSLVNVYNRKNFFYFDTKTGERVNMLPLFPSVNIKVEL